VEVVFRLELFVTVWILQKEPTDFWAVATHVLVTGVDGVRDSVTLSN
jgi:hypothetical protein